MIRVNKKRLSIFLLLVMLTVIAVFTILHTQHGGSLFPTQINARQSQYFSQEILYDELHAFSILYDGVIESTSNDPWILLFLDPSIPGHILHINISELSERETYAQVFYAPYGVGFSEAESIRFTLRDGTNTLILPRSNNAILRLDLTETVGISMILESVVLSNYTDLSWQFRTQFSVTVLIVVTLLGLLFFRTAFVMTQLRKFVPATEVSHSAGNTVLDKKFLPSFKRLSKLNLLLVVVSTLALRIAPLMRTFSISSSSEDLGSLFIAARLAGLEWLYVGGLSAYPGQVYNAIFTPLFMLTDNPLTIYLTILLFNAVLMTLFSIIIYSMAVIYCNLPDRYPTAFIAAFCSGVLFTDSALSIRNDVPVFLTVWLTALMLLIAINSETARKKLLATLGLIAVLFAGLIMHPWFITPIIVISVIALLYFLVYKTWVITPWVFYPGLTLFLVIAGILNLLLAQGMYADMVFSEIANAAFVPAQLLRHGLSPFTLFYTVITNVVALFVHTHGLAVISFIIFAIILCRVIKRKFIGRIQSDENIGLPRDQWVIMLVFTSSVALSLSGAYFDIRGVLFTFFGPQLLITFGFIYSNMKTEKIINTPDISADMAHDNNRKLSNMCFVAVGVFTVIYAYVVFHIMSAIEGHPRYGHIVVSEVFLPPFRGATSDLYATFVVTIGFFALLYFALHKQKPLLMSIPVYAFVLSIAISFISAPFFNVVPPTGRFNSIYSELKNIDEATGLPDRIYVSDDTPGFYALQFMLSRHTIVSSFPNADGHDSIYIGTHFTGYESYLRDIGFSPYFFPHNISLWIRGDDMRNDLMERAKEYDLEFEIISPEIAYLIDASDVENIFLNWSISSPGNLWVYQAIFDRSVIAPFNNTQALPEHNMENNVVFARRNDNVFLFSRRAVLRDLLIVTENTEILNAVIAMGGEIVADHDPGMILFEPNMPWVAPHDSLSGTTFALPVGRYEVTITGHGLSYAYFQIQYAHMTPDSLYFDYISINDYSITFSFSLDYDADSTQVVTSNEGPGFVRVDSIKVVTVQT